MNKSDFEDIRYSTGNVEVNINLSRWYERCLEAEKWVKERIVADMEPYIPIRTGRLRETIKQTNYANSNAEEIIAYRRPTPAYPINMYYGYNSNGKPMRFSNPMATKEWFKTAKENHYYEWMNGIRERIVGR